jgi:hypothetical protein
MIRQRKSCYLRRVSELLLDGSVNNLKHLSDLATTNSSRILDCDKNATTDRMDASDLFQLQFN